jgi:hypothetical protein
VNFLPPHLLSFNHERRLGQPYSLAPFVRHLGSVMLLILVIGGVTHWAELHGKVKAVLGSSVLGAVFLVWALPPLYGPRYLLQADIRHVDEMPYDGNMDSAYDTLIPEEEQHENESVIKNDDHCKSNYDSNNENSKVLLNNGGSLSEGKPFISFFGRHVALREVMCHWRSHLMMAMFMCISGSGLLVINNVQVCVCVGGDVLSSYFVSCRVVTAAVIPSYLPTYLPSSLCWRAGRPSLKQCTRTPSASS